MANQAHIAELETQLSRIDVGVIDSRQMAYRVLSVLRVEPSVLADVDEIDSACKELVRQNFDQCLIEDDLEDNTGEQ
jgi:hypothetical protein